MRVVPVIDLLNDRAAHAVRGKRELYRPVQTVLCDSADPISLVRAFRDRLNLHEIYIADLNSIQGFGRARHQPLIRSLCGVEGIKIMLDAGIPDFEDAISRIDLGVTKIVIGSETLADLENLQKIHEGIEANRLVFSLDLRNGEILSRCPSLKSMNPLQALDWLQKAGWREVILLDLNRVGSEERADVSLASEALGRFPDLRILIGGGIAKPEELLELKRIGVEGVLLATALHTGAIRAEHIEAS